MPKNKARKRIALSEPYLKGREEKYLKECVRTGWVSSCGPFVNRFESLVAGHAGSRYAVSVSSGTAALHTALQVLGVKENSEVIVPTLTFIASVNVIKYVGAHPIFMDCDDYLNIDAGKVKEFCSEECSSSGKDLINNRTGRKVKAIIPVHVGGHPVNIEPLMKLAKRFGLFVIEDAAEAIGSYYTKGKYKAAKAGTVGHIGCYSFNGNKIITSGGGGMVVTDNKDWADRARYLINQAKDDPLYYIHDNIGNNYRMTNVEAAVGVAQIERLKEFIGIKRRNFAYYKKKLNGLPGISLIEEPPYGFSNYWQYSLVVGRASQITRDGLLNALARNNIECRPLWQLNSIQKPYKDAQSYKIQKAKVFSESVISIPCSVGIKKDEMDRVVKAIEDAVK